MKRLKLLHGLVGLIDEQDFPAVSQFHWHVVVYRNQHKYINRSSNPRISLHQFLLNAPKRSVIDHINGNGLDNRRANLRICTHQENLRNQKHHADSKSPYKGIWRTPKSKTWSAQIWNGRKSNYLGSFRDPAEAARVYDFAARQIFGPFARLNFPEVAV